MMTDTAFFDFDGASYAYESGAKILSNVDWRIPEGAFHCLVGRSGCGKTTLLKLAATAEIYSEVERFKEVKESIVVGQSWDNDVRIILFIVMNTKFYLTEDLLKKIKLRIKKNASPRHVPSKIIQVKDIPRTKSGKIVELAVKNILDGNNIKNKEALANPEALKQFKNLKELSN